MALNKYISATQSLLNDPAAQRFPVSSLTTYINTGRSQLALEGECVRFNFGLDGIVYPAGVFNSTTTLTITSPSSNSPLLDTITAWNVTAPGLGYGTTVASYTTTTVNSLVYLSTITLSAAAPVSGTYSFQVSPPNNTIAQQEVYATPKSVCLTRGIKDVIGCRGIAVNFGSYGSNIYTLRYEDWTAFQAFYRVYQQLAGNPVIWTRYQDNMFLRPIPSSAYPMNWDCQCSVVDLVDDTTPEAIPYSFTDAIPYFAAYLALMSAQRKDDAKNMLDIYERFTKTGRRNVQSTFVPDIYATI